MPLPFLWPGPPLPLFYQWDLFKTPSPLMKTLSRSGLWSPFFQTIYTIYTKILKSCKRPIKGWWAKSLKFWSSIQLLGTNGLSAPPWHVYQVPPRRQDPLLPDLQFTAQPQLVSQSLLNGWLKCNFPTIPTIRWQLSAAFLLSPWWRDKMKRQVFPLTFSLLCFSSINRPCRFYDLSEYLILSWTCVHVLEFPYVGQQMSSPSQL